MSLLIPAERTKVVFPSTEEALLAALGGEFGAGLLALPTEYTGSTVAILEALLKSASPDSTDSVAIFPAAHYVSDTRAFMAHIDLAFEGVNVRPDLVVILGATPDYRDRNYVWVEPGKRVLEYFQFFHINDVWRDPSPELALKLWRNGCLWSTFVTIGQVSTLIRLIYRECPMLRKNLRRSPAATGRDSGPMFPANVYSDLRECDLSDKLLSGSRRSIAILPMSGVHWREL